MAVITRHISTVAGLTAELSSKLLAASNLSDLVSVATARTNLDTDSKAEVDAKITAAQLALGTRFRAADVAARDALADLDLADAVFVADDGDGKWAVYQPATIDGGGIVTAWDKLADQDALNNSITTTAFVSENVTVTGDTIVLTAAPLSGAVFNFGTVRNLGNGGVAYDIPVVIDGSDLTGKTFTLQPDTASQFDGLTVAVQYAHA